MSSHNTYLYNDLDFDPPAPVLNVELRIPDIEESSPVIEIPALFDSGADATSIPNELVEQLGLCQIDEISVGDWEGHYENRPIYSAHITINSFEPFIARVIPKFDNDEKKHISIGRDILNELLVILDGPKNQFYIKIKK